MNYSLKKAKRYHPSFLLYSKQIIYMIKNTTESPIHKAAHPIVFFFLFVPFGMVNGYLTVTLGFVYSKAGISTGMIAALVATMFIPQIFKFLWAPVVDVTLTVKKWYVLAAFFTALSLFATGLLPIKSNSWPA